MRIFFTLSVVLSLLSLSPLYGADRLVVDKNKPVLYYAGSQVYDHDLGILILRGQVEFHHEGTILTAEYVTYNEGLDVVTASGKVCIRQPNGDAHFAEYVELSGDLKEGLSRQLRTHLADDSKIAALEGRKCGGNEELDKAVYTPCALCGDKKPTWQLNARHALRDGVKNDIHFTDVEFRMWDTPLFYLPYATQPLERRTGFLIPLPRYSSDLGFMAEVPYFIVISEDKDITLTPTYISNQNPLLLTTYRQALHNGFLDIEGSLTKYRKSTADLAAQAAGQYTIPTARGHVYGNSQLNLNDIWRFKGEGGYVSDKTYFRKYVFSGWQADPTLPSKATLEGFLSQRDYGSAKIDYYQGLRTEDQQRNIPVVLPMLAYSAYSEPSEKGGRFRVDSNFLNLYRKEGVQMQRGIGLIEWRRPWHLPYGQLLNVFASTRGDLYQIHSDRPPYSQKKNGSGRLFPQGGIDWSWPFMTFWNTQGIILQPLIQMRGAPSKAIGVKASEIPNEDSLAFLFNELNLFSANRFPGYDIVDTGSRTVYGGQALLTGAPLGEIDLFFGQSYAYDKEAPLSKMQGIKKGGSDYVGHIEAYPLPWLSAHYRFRLQKKAWSPAVTEVGGSLGPAIAKLSGSYVYLGSNNRWIGQGPFEQLNILFSSNFTENFTFTASLLQNLRSKQIYGGSLIRGVGLGYKDDCFSASFGVQRQYFVARDVKPSTIYLLTIGLKNIGEYKLSTRDSYSADPDTGLGLLNQYNSARNAHLP